MRLRLPRFISTGTVLCFCLASFTGCDMIYGVLQKQGAEEKEILGDSMPFKSNSRVAEVQSLLKLYGYKVGKIDGALGVNTRNAVEAFQKDNDIKPSRFIDYETWDMLHVFEDYGLVVEGGLNIAAVQVALKEAGFDSGPVDGKLGRRTQETIQAFQKAEGLVPDGKVGYKTLWELAGYLPQIEE